MKTTIALLIACMLSACGADGSGHQDATRRGAEQAADTLYINGVIWTGAKGAPDAAVLAIEHGVVTYIGDGETVRIAAKETVDLEGRFVMPGFIDNHVHFLEGGAGLASVDLRDAAMPEVFSERITDYSKTWAEKRIGPDRIKTTYAFRSILDSGGILTFGSDWPVAPLSPLEGIYAAVTRRTTDGDNPDGWQPQEKITVEEALTAYTATNAYAGFEEDKAGTLETGKRADLVVLSDDPCTVDPVAVRSIKVLATMIGGEAVFRAKEK